MVVYNDDNKLLIIETKTFHIHFDLPKDVDKNLKYDIESIIQSNECKMIRTHNHLVGKRTLNHLAELAK